MPGSCLDVPEIDVPIHGPIPDGHTWREIAYTEHDGVGHLRFDFYNGAMSTDQCRRLLDAYRYARSRRHTSVIVLDGGEDFFSNGIHLNVIEAAREPGEESWWNLHAIDDVVREVLETDSHLVISALAGDAAAGGVPFALAADHVVAREDVVLNPYYQHMGGLYGSEYWTYLLPRRVGAEHGRRADVGAVPRDRDAARGRDRPDRLRVRRGRGELSGTSRRTRTAARTPPGSRALAPGEAPRAGTRRAGKAARRVPHRGARALARVLLRGRPQLPRGALALRLQDGRAVHGERRA